MQTRPAVPLDIELPLESGPLRSWRRAPTRAADAGLSSLAIAWLEQLPVHVRPRRLVDGFPRIVNRIARHWHQDPHRSARILRSLLVDERGGRAGFPTDVTVELLRLQFHQRRLFSRPQD